MLLEDFEPHAEPNLNRQQLDELLAELCEYVVGGQKYHPEFYGMVAAGVLDPSNRFVIGINFAGPDGKRVHAERAAIERYQREFGDIPKGSIVVTTLSPCNRPMDERYSESCEDLLSAEGIDKVYCGYKDPSQDIDSSIETTNLQVKTLCKAFADTFLKPHLHEDSNKEVLRYIKHIHPKGEFTIDHSVMNHAEWELTSVPISSLHLDDEANDPYSRVQYIDYDYVRDITRDEIKNKPIVVDLNGWVIDGNHRAVAAREMGMTHIPAYVPVEDPDHESYEKFMARQRRGLAEDKTKSQEFIDNVYSQYPDWPYGQADKVMVWGEGEDQQFAAFKLKPSLQKDTVEIDWLMAGPEQRKGIGSRAIKELQRQAQEAGVKLALYPWGKGRISQASLTKLYKRHGFKPFAKGARQMAWEPLTEARQGYLPEGMKIYVDLDGVVADWLSEYCSVAGKTKDTIGEIPKGKNDPIRNQIKGTDFYNRIPKYPSADQLIQIVTDAAGGYYICTAPHAHDYENCELNKRKWIARELHPQPINSYVTSRKYQYAKNADGSPNVLIDDKVTNLKPWHDAGGIAIFYDAEKMTPDVVYKKLKSLSSQEELTELKIDNKNGLGSVPWNQEVDYMGLRVMMKPSKFLELSLPLSKTENDRERIDYLAQHRDDQGFGAPFLQVDMEPQIPTIVGHDGRHRMEAILDTEGDHPVEVHIFPRYMRNRDMTPELVDKLNDLVIGQRGKYVRGPLFSKEQLEEISRRDFMKAGALGAAALASGGIGWNRIKHQLDRPVAEIKNSIEKMAMNTAKEAGIRGTELAAFLAQMKHESQNFTHMKEVGNKHSAKYDPQINPAKAKRLGNTQPGDGERYKGRGMIQLTGRENYRRAGRALGLPLEQHPELAENPKVASDIAVWYWKERVRPNVTDWHNTAQVTKPINPALKDLHKRDEYFQKYLMASL